MNFEEYKKYVANVIEKVAEKKMAQEANSEYQSIDIDTQRTYTPEDVVHDISQMSPEDRNLAIKVVEDIETRIRPRELLTSIDDKVQFYDNLKSAKDSLRREGIRVSNHRIKPDLDYLVVQGIIEKDVLQKYCAEDEMLKMVLNDRVKTRILNKNVWKTSLMAGIPTFSVGMGSVVYAMATFNSGWGAVVYIAGLLGTILSTGYIGEKAGMAVMKKNEIKAREKMREYESNFAFRLMTLEQMTRKMYESVNSGEVMLYNLEDEKTTVMAIGNARKYFKDVLDNIPRIRKCYKALKDAESGLPVKNNEMPLLTAKSINTDKE